MGAGPGVRAPMRFSASPTVLCSQVKLLFITEQGCRVLGSGSQPCSPWMRMHGSQRAQLRCMVAHRSTACRAGRRAIGDDNVGSLSDRVKAPRADLGVVSDSFGCLSPESYRVQDYRK